MDDKNPIRRFIPTNPVDVSPQDREDALHELSPPPRAITDDDRESLDEAFRRLRPQYEAGIRYLRDK